LANAGDGGKRYHERGGKSSMQSLQYNDYRDLGGRRKTPREPNWGVHVKKGLRGLVPFG